MGDRLHMAVGVMGNAASLLLYAAPILTFKRVIKKKSTEELSCVPYILALSKCLLHTWYGLPIKQACLMVVPVFAMFFVTAFVSTFAVHDHHHRKLLVGSVGLVASVAMSGAPLVAAKRVIQTKSVEFMPFYLSFFSFLACLLWMTHGLLAHDILLASPNLVGTPLAITQLVLYFIYRKNNSAPDQHIKSDLEKNALQLKSQQAEVNGKN
ncbi:hypothetical protein MRB53_035612 [Persea americana]|uniref:Uncharacterized protein n=1 Tax=Persea americana TaxID=3435 RepID=A0ACC2K538_PERAE|nr:hypothetical protein MRB53_035612 [Persea americana]